MPREPGRSRYVPSGTAIHRRQPKHTVSTERSRRTRSQRPHDDIAYVTHQRTDRANGPSVSGWTHPGGSASRRRSRGRRLGAFLLLIPLMVGLLGVPTSPTSPGIARGDELSDAKAKQAQLKKDIEAQKSQVAQLAALQSDLSAGIRQTANKLKGINADLAALKVRSPTWKPRSR